MKQSILSFIIGSFVLLSYSQAWSQTETQFLSVIGVEYPPFSYKENNQLKGVGVEIINLLGKDTGIKILPAIPGGFKRLELTVQETNFMIPILAKIKERENLYHWIGKITTDVTCFYNLKDDPTINSIDQALKLRTIGVNAGGANEKYLRTQGFKNLAPLIDSSKNIELLVRGEIDAVYSAKLNSQFATLKLKHKPSQFHCGKEVQKMDYYIAASIKTKSTLIEKLKKSFNKLKNEGKIDNILKNYHIHKDDH